MSQIKFFLSPLIAVVLSTGGVLADTVILKSGEHLEGKITAETDKDVTMEVQVSAGITDEKVVPKAQIQNVQKTTPEIDAYQKLIPIQLGKDSMSVAQYDPYIEALQAFVTQFPNSVRAIDVQKTLNAFQDEKKRVEAGEIKLEGQWLSKAEVEKERVQIGGQMMLSYMKSQSAAGEYVPALNTFAAIEKSFAGSAAMPEAIVLAKTNLTQLEAVVRRAIPNQKALVAQQTKDLAAASPADRAVMAAAIKREQSSQDAAVTAAGGSAWPPFYPANEKSLTALSTKLQSEAPRIAALPVEKMKESLQLTLDSKQNIAAGDIDGALDKLKQATSLWSVNELAQRLTKEAEQQKTAVASAATAAAAATPAPAAATPKMRRGAPLPAAAATTSAQATTSGTVATPAPAPPAVATASAAKPADNDDPPFIKTPAGMIVAVASLGLLLGGANLYLKMKKRKAEGAANS